jgi:hypothetical protein
MGARGQYSGEKFNVKLIPTLVLLDEIGNLITTDVHCKRQGGDQFPLDESRQRANLHNTSTELSLDGQGSRSKGFGHEKEGHHMEGD